MELGALFHGVLSTSHPLQDLSAKKKNNQSQNYLYLFSPKLRSSQLYFVQPAQKAPNKEETKAGTRAG